MIKAKEPSENNNNNTTTHVELLAILSVYAIVSSNVNKVKYFL